MSISRLATLLVPVFALACSSTPKAEGPTDAPAGSSEPEVKTGPDKPDEGAGEPGPSDAPKPKGKDKDNVPDDYELTNSDCAALGKQFADLIRGDEVGKLPAKMKDKQREAATASIEKASTQRGDQWIEGCQKSLVGKVVDRKVLKCAMDARNVKAFDECINGPVPDKGKPAPKE